VSTQSGASCARYAPWDVRLRGAVPHANPFLADVRATVTGPGGRRSVVPGFYDGDGTWIVRFCPDAEGDWHYTTESSAPDLDGHAGRVTCVANRNPRVHGALRVDPEHPYHFRYEDGTRPFVLGYEANWLWALTYAPGGAERIRRFCERIARFGFNHVFVNAYAYDTRWCPGASSADDYGPPPACAWEGTNDAPDFRHPNVDYWRHFDLMMRALFDFGLTAHVYLRVYNKFVTWPANRSLADDLYFAYVVARYQGFSNVVWDFAKESYNEPDKDYLANRLSFVRAHDAYQRLVTTHDDDLFDADPRYRGTTDFVTDQHHVHIGHTALDRRRLRAAPYVNEEFAYECGPGGLDDKTYTRSNTPEEHALRSWEVALCGAYPGYYYTYTAWDVIRPEDEPPGYALHQTLSEFMRRCAWWRLDPHPEMVTGEAAWCLAHPGEEYIVGSAGRDNARTVLIGATAPGQRFACTWLQPLTGQRAETTDTPEPRGELRPPWSAPVPAGERPVRAAPPGPFVVRLRPLGA
jgi:hypothetical protein